MTSEAVRIDVSELRSFAFGSRSTLFWGTACLCMIEGTALALLFMSYFYVRGNFDEWPPSAAMRPLPGALSTAVLAASLVPMTLTGRAARDLDLARTRRWQIASTMIGAVGLALRAWELHSLPFLWTENAYATIVWVALGIHTVDYVAEMGEMVVLSVLFVKGPIEDKHFEDVEVNAFFWAFLAIAWLPFAGVLYTDGAPR